MVYATLHRHSIDFERIDCDEAITMEDCVLVDEALHVSTVKTLFLCNRQQTNFYLFITTANKPFVTKDFSAALGISRVSFATPELLKNMLGTVVGAATIFGVLLDLENRVQVVIDKEVEAEEFYGCTDGTTTGYMKLRTRWILKDFLAHARHMPKIIQL